VAGATAPPSEEWGAAFPATDPVFRRRSGIQAKRGVGSTVATSALPEGSPSRDRALRRDSRPPEGGWLSHRSAAARQLPKVLAASRLRRAPEGTVCWRAAEVAPRSCPTSLRPPSRKKACSERLGSKAPLSEEWGAAFPATDRVFRRRSGVVAKRGIGSNGSDEVLPFPKEWRVQPESCTHSQCL
jgi:hypothetical protein